MADEEAHGGMETVAAAEDIDSRVQAAIRSRVSHFKEQADTLTLEGVRRLIEKDLGLELNALDAHKRIVKKCLQECLDGDDDVSKSSQETTQNGAASNKEAAELSEEQGSVKEVKEAGSENEDKMEDSPVMGLMTAKGSKKTEKERGGVSESEINKAIKKRASYFRANSETLTMAGVRRLLEEDLELDKHALDPFKKFIIEHVDEVLSSAGVSKSARGTEVKDGKKSVQRKVSKKVSSEGNSDSLDHDEDVDEVKPRKKVASKGRSQKAEVPKKRKVLPAKETKAPSKKRIKKDEAASDSNSDTADQGQISEDGESQSSHEKKTRKKEVSTPVYGKRVERLKSVIKSCGMSVPPAIYKKVKQVPEDEREDRLVKELEEILSREGLSSSPSEKEIKEVRKRKERAKELEGIDMSNIVSSSRRRTTSSYVPPKPEIAVGSDSEKSGESGDEEEDEEDEEEDENDDNNDGNDDSQSEDLSDEDQEESD